MTQQDDITQRVLPAEQEAVRHALELYAETYDTMTRIARREGRELVVSPVSVAVDIRRNMVNGVLRALSKLRAPVADANRWRWISAQYDDMKTSEVERFLELLGLDASEPYARLGEFVDRMTGDAAKPAASDAEDIPDFGGGSGNKARRRAAALRSQRQESAPVAGEAQVIGYVPPLYLEMRRRGMPVNSKIQHSPGDDATAPLYASPQSSAEYERGHADGWAAGWDQAIKQPQADKDGCQQRASLPAQPGAQK